MDLILHFQYPQKFCHPNLTLRLFYFHLSHLSLLKHAIYGQDQYKQKVN